MAGVGCELRRGDDGAMRARDKESHRELAPPCFRPSAPSPPFPLSLFSSSIYVMVAGIRVTTIKKVHLLN